MSTLKGKLSGHPYFLTTTVLSIDDLYLTHKAQSELAAAHPTNPLVQHRGQPSTHDLALAITIFSDLRNKRETSIPHYEKSMHNGKGDRAAENDWNFANAKGQPKTEVVLFEGWCVGFRALARSMLQSKWENARRLKEAGNYRGMLGLNEFASICFVNDALKHYDQITDQLDALIHLDAADPMFVYAWRLQQEKALRKAKGTGMTDVEVIDFVNGYYPAYELYTDNLREGALGGKGTQLRLVIDVDRKIKETIMV